MSYKTNDVSRPTYYVFPETVSLPLSIFSLLMTVLETKIQCYNKCVFLLHTFPFTINN